MNLKSRLEDLRTGGNPVRKGIPKIVEIRMGFPNGISEWTRIRVRAGRPSYEPDHGLKSRLGDLRAGADPIFGYSSYSDFSFGYSSYSDFSFGFSDFSFG